MRTRSLTRWTIGAAASLALAAGVALGVGGPTREATLTASDGTNSNFFGRAAAIAGDTAVVGADGKITNRGAAYVFTRTGSTWTEQASLTASDAANQDHFGRAVAIVGDTALVGANRSSSTGSVYVFTRSGTTWTPQGKIAPTDPTQNDNFGWSIAFEGDTAVVGSHGKNSAQGAVYVFTRAGTTWTQQAKLVAEDPANNDFLGSSVALSGDTVVAGAYGKNSSQGAAYVFTRTGTAWTQQQKLTDASAADDERFGFSVALAGETAVVAASEKSSQSISRRGAVYVFTRSGTTWTQQAELTADDAAADDRLGESVALAGDTLVAAAPHMETGRGAAYLFKRTGGAWAQNAKLTSGSPALGELFGTCVVLGGSTLVAGVSERSSAKGAVEVFRIPADAPLSYCLATKVKAKANAGHPEKSKLTASGTLDTGAGVPSFSGAATFDVGGFHLDIPAFVAQGANRTFTGSGVTLKITPSTNGSSRTLFSVKAVGAFAGKVDLNGPLDFHFTNGAHDVTGTAKLTAGVLGPHGVTAPAFGVLAASAKIKGGGKDTLNLTLTFATDGSVPAAGEDLTICFGDNFTALLSGASFVRRGDTWTRKSKAPGFTKTTVDYAKGTITVAASGLDLGAFAVGGNAVAVTVVRGSDSRTARIRMTLAGTKLAY